MGHVGRVQPGEQPQRLGAIGGLRDDLDVAVAFEQTTQARPGASG